MEVTLNNKKGQKSMKIIRCIDLEDLAKKEKEEYETLNTLSAIRYDYEKEGKLELARSIEDSVKYQRGRWGMLKDLIEELEEDDNE